MKKTYYVEVTETHYIYVDAETETEAEELAIKEAFNNVPDVTTTKIIKDERSKNES